MINLFKSIAFQVYALASEIPHLHKQLYHTPTFEVSIVSIIHTGSKCCRNRRYSCEKCIKGMLCVTKFGSSRLRTLTIIVFTKFMRDLKLIKIVSATTQCRSKMQLNDAVKQFYAKHDSDRAVIQQARQRCCSLPHPGSANY